TSVNGKPLAQRLRLIPGDRIELPGTVLTFREDSAAGTVTPALLEPPSTESLATVVSSLDLTSDLRVDVEAAAKLRAVLEISRTLGTSLDLEVVLPKILESLFTVFPQADRGFILLRDPITGQMVPRAVRHRTAPGPAHPALSRTVISHALATRRAVLSADAGTDERFDSSQSVRHLELRSIMCVPMLRQDGQPVGVLQIDTRDRRRPFSQEDLDVLLCASTQAARAVELACLHEEQRDMQAATRIQHNFLPSGPPVI